MKRSLKVTALAGTMAAAVALCSSCGLVSDFVKMVKRRPGRTVLNEDQKDRYAKLEEKLEQIDAALDYFYLNDDEIDPQAMEDSLLRGYVEGLGERYTTYYTAEEYQKIQETTNGEYDGIGMSVVQDVETMNITVLQVFENGPGYAAGLAPGDILYKVNGEEIIGQDVDLVVKDIKGEAGTPVSITVYRPETDEYIDMTMNRAHIEQPTVAHEMLADNIGYIEVASFDLITERQFDEAIEDLLAQGMKGLVIDLRNNPGGVMDTVCAMLDRILPADQLLVYTIDKNDVKEEERSEDEETLDLPMAVVVNGNSASASEIFTAALQDYDKAEIVGETTFGKGVVQVLLPLSDGSAMKMTTSKYYTPNGVCIHGIGVTPDIEVEQVPQEEGQEEIDEQLEAAVSAVKAKIN